jgi:pimeloyl-ACP methyl ester carboxylesterase
VLICAATKDFFPIQGTWDSFREAKRIYTLLGIPERVDLIEANEVHGFSQRLREGAVHWMQRWLLDRDEDVAEHDVAVLSAEQIRCTPDGEVLKMDGARSVVDINVEEAKRLAERRRMQWAEWDDDQRVAKIRETASIRPLDEIPLFQTENPRRIKDGGISVISWNLRYRDKIVLSATEFVPEKPNPPTVLYVHDGINSSKLTGGTVGELIVDGHCVWAVDLSGFGQSRPQQRYIGWGPQFGECWQQYFLAYMLDKSLVGMRTEDILACARYLNDAGEDGTTTPVRMDAHGACSVPALHAAALHPELFREVRLVRGLRSWENVVNLKARERQLEGTVHGALRVYDLPDLAEMAGGRTAIIWESALDAAMKPVLRDTQELHAKLRRRTETTFKSAAFLKPREESADKELIKLAPLIVQQCESAEAFKSFGHVASTESGARYISDGQRAVYTWEDRVRVGDRDLRRMNFLWFYILAPDEPGRRARGFRMVLDEENYPIVWQTLGEMNGLQLLYVSESLERKAAETHGRPLPCRAFAIESSIEQRPDVVVARVLEDGPIPMGPYAYLDDRLEITTMLCRCMPAQVDEFAVNDDYDLVRIDGIEALNLGPALRQELQLDALLAPIDLGAALRWP